MGINALPARTASRAAYYQPTAPSNPAVGEIWVDSDDDAVTYDASVQTGFRNVLINGGMEIAQRGTVSPALSTYKYPVDRWWMYTNGAALTSHGRTTTVIPPSGPIASVALQGNTGVVAANLGTRLESSTSYMLRGAITFSAYVYNGSGADCTPIISLSTANSTDDWTIETSRFVSALQVCANGAWTRVYATTDCSGWTDLSKGMSVALLLPAASLNSPSKYMYVTGVQLERGSIATPFEQRTYGMELALCQRYYLRYNAGGQFTRFGSLGYAYNTTSTRTSVLFPVRMRATPTLFEKSNVGMAPWRVGGSYSTGTFSVLADVASADGVEVDYTHGTAVFTTGDVVSLYSLSTAAYVAFGAEL
jgi:hypothetical protein